MTEIRVFAVTLFVLLLLSHVVHAQQESGPSSLLPDIDPQDIEIRGDFQVRFPGLSRQPILGFNPRPPVFRINPDRMPFMETAEEIVAAIPISHLEPALTPEYRFIQFADRSRLYAYGGFGSFQSPEAQIIAESPLRTGESISFDMTHHSSDGHRDFSSFRDLNGNLQWTRQTGKNRWGIGLRGASSFNYSPVPGVAALVQEPGRINSRAFGAEARWQQLQNAYRGWQVSLSLQHFAGEASHQPAPEHSMDETRYRVFVNRFWEGLMPEQIFGIQADIKGSTYQTGRDTSRYWLTNTLGARYRHTFSSFHQVEAWLRFYQLYDTTNEFDLYLYPDVYYLYRGTRRVTARIRLRGFISDPSLEMIHNRNRFAMRNKGDLEHERGLHINLHTDIKIIHDLEVFTGADYYQYYKLGFFKLWDDPLLPYYDYQYTDDAIHVEWYYGLRYFFDRIRTTATIRMGLNYTSANKEVIPSEEIPYIPKWKGTGMIVTRPVSWLYLSGWMDINGKRPTGIPNEMVDGFIQLGAKAEAKIHSRFGFYVKGRNMLDRKYEVWQNYEERPMQIYGGLTLYW